MIRLETFDESDFDTLKNWIHSEALLTNWSGSLFRFPLSDESLKWYIEDTNVKNESDAFVFKVLENATDRTVGHISLGGISWKNRSARISRVLINPDDQGKNYCRYMVAAVLRYGFEELQLHRIGLGVYTHNKAAIRCYERAGLIIEGIQKDVMLFEGSYWSMAEMAILEDEWRLLMHKTENS